MKNIRFLTLVLLLGTLVLSACGAAPAIPTAIPAASAKVEAMPVSFVGIVDSIAGDQWVISGTTVTVDATIVRDGPFNIGDQVKVEGLVNPNGSFTISRVEAPTPQETATLPSFNDDNTSDALGNANTNDANVNDDVGGVNSNDDNSNDINTNDDNGGNTNDDNGNGNVNDDNGGNDNGDDHGGNSNDDNGNDDNSGNSND